MTDETLETQFEGGFQRATLRFLMGLSYRGLTDDEARQLVLGFYLQEEVKEWQRLEALVAAGAREWADKLPEAEARARHCAAGLIDTALAEGEEDDVEAE